MAAASIRHPALRAIAELSRHGIARVVWNDGDDALVRYDTFVPDDETDDGSEQWVVDVVEVLELHASSRRALTKGAPTTISSNDPPARIHSPDNSRTWPSVSSAEWMELILKALPAFKPALNAYRASWGDDLRGLCNELSALTDFVLDRVEADAMEDFPSLFDTVEMLMVDGDSDVKDAVATCFLENLLNVTPRCIPPERFVPLLGPESRAFCRAWDEFTGVKTPGLWNNRQS